jgi:phosphodiesterase/alkaline phosphatase D-like protein
LNLYKTTLQNIAAHKPDFLIDLGDTFMTDRLNDTSEAGIRSKMLEVRDYFQDICHSIPIYLANGNHEGENGYFLNKPRRKDIPLYATLQRKELFPNPYPDKFYSGNSIEYEGIGLRENYYAWTWGSALFIVLDPHWYTEKNPMQTKDPWDRSLGKEQYDWLEKNLEAKQS